MNQTGSRGLKALLLGMLLCFSLLAQALPTPKDIEASVKAGQLDRAETQLREVLAEKPSSAKAHYELGQVLAREGRYIEAEQALKRAQTLEPSLKFASNPQKFKDLLTKVGARTAAPSSALATQSAAPATMAARAAPSRSEPSIPWGMVLLGVGGIALLVVWMRRAASANALRNVNQPVQVVTEPRGFGHSYSPAQPYPSSYPAYQPAPPAGNGMGSAVTGAVVGGLAGVAAGYALSKVLEGEQHGSTAGHAAANSPDTGYIPIDTPRAAPDFGDFDAGAGDGWDGGGSDSDNW